MSKYKNISGGALDVRVPGFECYAEAGDVIDIPDFQPDGTSPIIVPPDKWEPVKATKKSASSSEAGA